MNRYHVKSSTIQGLGLFASEFLPKGTIWWRATPNELIFIKKEQYEALRALSNGQSAFLIDIERYGYYIRALDSLAYICTDARYLNHSSDPNSAPTEDRLASVTLRDVACGEELLEDYRSQDVCPWANLAGEFGKSLGLWRI